MIDTCEIQKAIYTALTADAALMALITGVFDHVPEGQAKPYISIGEDTAEDNATKDCPAVATEIIISTWTDGPGRKEAKEIATAIQTAIEAGITMTGQYAVALQVQNLQTVKDNDGEIIHGIIKLNGFIHKEQA